jgi:DNA-binding MarR family transcriptional regulator
MKNVALLVADVYEAAGALRAAGEAIASTEGQTQARWQVLSVVSEQPVTVPQAARRLGVSRQNVQRISNDLVRDELAEWVPNPHHQTSPHLGLTKRGHRVLARINERAGDFHSFAGRGITNAQITAMRTGLATLIANSNAYDVADG